MHSKLGHELMVVASSRYSTTLRIRLPYELSKPRVARRFEYSWPTIVIECGASESLEELRRDCQWWLTNSAGEVSTALLLSVDRGDRRIRVEMWEWLAVPNQHITRSRPHPTIMAPTKSYEFTSTDGISTGGLLRLDFQRIFLRQPGPGEGDVIFTVQDLEALIARFWSDLP